MERAAAERAKARHRRNLLIGALVAVAVAGLVTAVAMNSGHSKKSAGSGSPSANASATGAANFPPLPPGADPALRTKPATTAGSGALAKLVVTPLVQGTGAATAAGQTITVNYVGVSYQTGVEFDSSWKQSQPFTFQLGAGNVIAGWDQGLVGVKVGSRVQLDIPSDLAYGDTGRQPGPLRFIVDVLGAK